MTDDIGYQRLTQAAMRGVMKEALKIAASDVGLPGDHHYYITFRTRAPGVSLADQLAKRFPDEMTIVIQHQYWDLEVHEKHFEIVLQFSGVPQHLTIPYAAVTRFVDPSVNFGIGFEPMAVQQADGVDTIEPLDDSEIIEDAEDIVADAPMEGAAGDDDESRPASDGTVVSLDAFRRK